MTFLSAQRLRDSLIGKALIGEAGVRFHLRTLLGEGGQGWVFKSNYDDPDGFWIVVKMLRHEGINDDSLRRFDRETKVLQMLGSVPTPNPNIVRFYDHGIFRMATPVGEIALPFIALEYVDGPTLSTVIDQHGGFGMPLGHTVSLMKQVARALGTVHEHRIVHRDLKPSNILLANVQGQQIAKVTDFGLVKMTDLSAKSTATVAGATLGYAPPEQYEMGNNRVGVQTDIFSYAAILYEVLSGQIAFPHKQGDSPLRTVARMLTGDRPSLLRVAATLPPELRGRPDLVRALDEEIARATAPDPQHRHLSIIDLWGKVEPILRDAQRGSFASGPFDDLSRGQPLDPSFPAPARVSGTPSPHFTMVGRPILGERLRAATFAPDDGMVLALGARSLYAFSRGGWSPLPAVGMPHIQSLHGLSRLTTGELLVYGEAGAAIAITRGGSARRVLPPMSDVTWLGAHTEDGDMVLVGERRLEGGRIVGALAEVGRGGIQVRDVEGVSRLSAVTRVAGGTFIACGTHGALVHLLPAALVENMPGRPAQQEVVWGRTGHLTAVCRSFDGGAYAVGSGGHALAIRFSDGQGIGPAPEATLEVVQTTRDLSALALDSRGVPWAGGGQARLLMRERDRWVRVPLDATESTLIGLSMGAGKGPELVTEDGTVLQGLFV